MKRDKAPQNVVETYFSVAELDFEGVDRENKLLLEQTRTVFKNRTFSGLQTFFNHGLTAPEAFDILHKFLRRSKHMLHLLSEEDRPFISLVLGICNEQVQSALNAVRHRVDVRALPEDMRERVTHIDAAQLETLDALGGVARL